MSFGPTNYRQGGTRGGADQFKWEDVKNDKYRENYLGHSVQAPVGRWQKGKDLSWYTKLNKEDRAAALQDDFALAKQRDQDLMDQALGIAPRRRAEPTGQLDAFEMKELLKRGASDREGLDGERIEGIGAAPVAQDFATKPKKTLAEKYEERLASGREEEDIHALRGSASAGPDKPRTEKEERALKKAAKKQKKKEKKAKKEKKRERKRERRQRDESFSEGDDERLEQMRGRSQDRRSPVVLIIIVRGRGRGRPVETAAHIGTIGLVHGRDRVHADEEEWPREISRAIGRRNEIVDAAATPHRLEPDDRTHATVLRDDDIRSM